MSSSYVKYSPWYGVSQTWYLGYNSPVSFPRAVDDTLYVIPTMYDKQPWRLSKDLYGDERLYYIFALVNPNELEDPVFDFTAGTTIYLPTDARVKKYIGK